MASHQAVEGRLTADRETIRQWGEEHDRVPVRVTKTGSADEATIPYQLSSETDQTETMETLSWEEFFQQVDENELVVISHGQGDDRTFEAVHRDQAVSRASLADTEVEDRLLTGETITSEITETTVIERTIVEQATIESEVVDRETLDSRVVDAKFQSRQIGNCNVVDRDALDEGDHSRFEDMSRLEAGGIHEKLPRPIAVEVDVDEDWLVTREVLERATIESRIVDTDTTETDEVESESLESSIEIEGVQHALLESDVIETEAEADEVIQSEIIESEFHDDDGVVRTKLTQRRIVEEEITEQKVLRGDLTESEIVQVQTNASTPIETAFVDTDTLDTEMSPVGVTEYESTAAVSETDTARDDEMRMVPTDDDVGKRVVDSRGKTVGLVEEVREGTAYVDPEPGVVDRIKAALDWGDANDDAYPLEPDHIGRITDDEIELSVPK